MAFKIQLHGVRGALPAPLGPAEISRRIEEAIKAFLVSGRRDTEDVKNFMQDYPCHLAGGFGGHTTCVEVHGDNSSLLIDCGSGVQKAVDRLMAGPCGRGEGEVHILLTHFHWDRLMGLAFFRPLFLKGNQIHFYAVQKNLKEALQNLFRKPHFPVPYEALEAKILLHPLAPRKKVMINEFTVTPYRLDHPDECWGYRIEKDGLSYSHCADTEFTRMTEESLGEDLALYHNSDLMLFDAQYSINEASRKINWGHAAANFGIDLALKQQVKQILFVNHDPAASDQVLKNLSQEVEKYYQRLVGQLKSLNVPFHPLAWEFAREDTIVEVGQ